MSEWGICLFEVDLTVILALLNQYLCPYYVVDICSIDGACNLWVVGLESTITFIVSYFHS